VAPATTAPEASFTVPEIAPASNWPKTGIAVNNKPSKTAMSDFAALVMRVLLGTFVAAHPRAVLIWNNAGRGPSLEGNT
jgi:hypothetical protein